MILHHIIDGVNGKLRNAPQFPDDEARLDFLALAARAECFDFGEIVLEKSEKAIRLDALNQSNGYFEVPGLTPEEEEMWVEGLIPFPSATCWYEFVLNGQRSGILIQDLKGENYDFAVQRCSLNVLNGVWVKLLRQIGPEGRAVYLDAREKTRLPNVKDRQDLVAYVAMARYLTLMLNSKTTELAKRRPDAALNKSRAKADKSILKPHTVVTIVPASYMRGDGGDGTHASPRLHWRRSHRRTLPSGKFAIVVRHLVGRRELGEVSHEYVFKQSKRDK